MRRKTITLSIIGLLIVFAILYLSDTNKVLSEIGKISVESALLLLGIQILAILFAAAKWRIILRHSKVAVKNLLPATLVGYFVNGVTPIGLAGGEPVRAYIISKTDNVPLTTAASSVIVDLFLEITPMFLFSGIAVYYVFARGVPVEIAFFLAIIALALFSLFCLAVAVMLNRGFTLRLVRKTAHILAKLPFLRGHIHEIMPEVDQISRKFSEAIRLHMMDNTTLFFGTTISFIVWGLRFLRTYIIFAALGATQVDFPIVLVVETAVSVLSFLPLFPGSLGIWEGASTALYVIMTNPSVGEATAAAATLINRFYLFFLPLVVGFAAAVYLGLNISKITNSNQEIETEAQS